MKKSELREIVTFPKALDEAVRDKFGVECSSYFDLLGTGNYVTRHSAKGAKAKEINAFISGFIAGNIELANRLPHTEKWNSLNN